MGWLLLYVYVIGVVNDFMYAVNYDANLKDWRVHVNIAAWPITVPLAVVWAMFVKDED